MSQTFAGGSGSDSTSTGGGSDSLVGDHGSDSLLAGAGADTLVGGGGLDSLLGEDGEDRLEGGHDNDTLHGGAGADTLAGDSHDDSLMGGTGDDSISGDPGADTILAGAGDDTLNGGNQNDLLDGGDGHDSLFGDSDNDTLTGGDGNDTLNGQNNEDLLQGGTGDDSLFGDHSNDTFQWSPGQGNDTIDGGNNNDRLLVNTPGFTNTTLSTTGSTAITDGWQWVASSGDGDYRNAGFDTYRYIPTGETLTIRNVETSAICFYPGTMIATPEGERAVETLARSDLVLTREGKARAIRWMGRQTVSTRFADPLRVLPIRIEAGALADGIPARDLLLSPDHAILVEDVLIQAGALVNGTSIRREVAVPSIFTYHHVELSAHELILAEAVPAETFVDNVHRRAFDNWHEHVAMFGDLPAIAEMDRPRAKAERQVPRPIQERIAARALRGPAGTAAA